MLNIITELNMKKKSLNVVLLSVFVTSILVIPTYGIMSAVAEEKQEEGDVKNLQGWCCSWIEQEKDNIHTLSTPNTIVNEYFGY
jgi:hypothetical protein